MRIERVETYVLRLEGEQPYLGAFTGQAGAAGHGYRVRPPWRSLYSPRYETLLVKITAEDGTVGWGEGLAPVAPQVPAGIIDLLLGPALIGADARKPRPAWSKLRDLMRERGHLGGHQADALAAVDIALWDLLGRLTGRSVTDLLGGAFRTRIPAYVSGLPRATDGERAALATEWATSGAETIKLHLGHGLEQDLATFDAVQGAAPELSVAVDAHWAYSINDALVLAEQLATRGCRFLEAPLAPEDVLGHAELVARTRIPIAVGETLRHRYEFLEWLGRRALRIAQPDVGRTGITEALIIAEIASAHHVPVAPHHSVGLGVALLAGLQVAAAVDSLACFEFQPTSTEIGNRILRRPVEWSDGGFALPDGPGLGVDVDTERVRELADPATDGDR